MPVQVDMTGVSVEGPPLLDDDKYPAIITKADVHDSKNSQEPTLYLDLAVGEEGRNLRWNTSLQPNQLWKLKRFLVEIGIEVPDGPFEFDEADLVGIECVVEVGTEPNYRDPNRKQNRVLNVLGSGSTDEDGEGSWG